MSIQKDIATALQKLRQERRLSQAELAHFLSVSQPTLSLIEQGKSSLTAEQFLNILKHYNLGLEYFVPVKVKNEETQIQNLLARFGARHLRESSASVSNKYCTPNELIFAVLSSPLSARQLTALAPVVLRQIQNVIFPHLFHQLKSLGQEGRCLWFLDNLNQALELRGKDFLTTAQKKDYRLALRIIKEECDILTQTYEGRSLPSPEFYPDTLFRGTTSLKSRTALLAKRDSTAKKWNILTDLTAKDFYKALVEADANDR